MSLVFRRLYAANVNISISSAFVSTVNTGQSRPTGSARASTAYFVVCSRQRQLSVASSKLQKIKIVGESPRNNIQLQHFSKTAVKMATLSEAVKAKLDKVADVRIDEKGRFKYILIKVFAKDENGKHVHSNSKLVVRGRADCPFHGDIFDKFQEETSHLEGIDDDILGGGRIERTGNKIFVFGYSQGYGKADHTLTVEILKKQFPTHEITWSDEGY